MNKFVVKVGDIIKIGDGFDSPKAKILRIYTYEQKKTGLCGDIEVIYNQNNLKSVKDDLIWNNDDNMWNFKNQGPSGVVVGIIAHYPELK